MTGAVDMPVVRARNLTKRYAGRRGSAGVTAVDAVSLEVRRGEVYGFLGPNGAGKTTTMRILLGLIRPTGGAVEVLGRRPGDPEALARVGSMVEGPAFYPFLTGRQNLAVVARYARVEQSAAVEALDAVGLGARGNDRFGTYSLGMKQRLGVAAALLKRPELVVLDEPTNGLDPAGMRDMRALIRDLGSSDRTVLLSSHLMGEVEQVCDRIGVIDDGRMVVETTVEDLRGERDLVVVATPSDVARKTLDQMPEVDAVSGSDGTLRLSVQERHTAAVTRALVRAGVDVTEVRRVDRQLEDLFFEITAHDTATQEETHV